MVHMSNNKESKLKEIKACFGFSRLGFLIGALGSSIPVIIAVVFLIHQIGPEYEEIYQIILIILIILIFIGAICGGALSGYAGEFGPKIGILGLIIGGIGGIAGIITAERMGDFLAAIVIVLAISGILGIIILTGYLLTGAGGSANAPCLGEGIFIGGILFGLGIGFPSASIGITASYAIGGQLGFGLAAAIARGLIGGITSFIVGFLCSGGIGAFFSSRECLKRCQRTLPNWIAQHGSLDLESLNDAKGRLAKFVLSYFPTKREWIVSWVKNGKFPPSLQLRENETKLVDSSKE
ncbi:MAG: hypothetical protein ACFFC7_09580 [Candidatus Hermodarchaeota archaeon]